jgi:hypothetical protein
MSISSLFSTLFEMTSLVVYWSEFRFQVLSWGIFLEGEDSHGYQGLGSLVELRFKAPPGTSYSCTTIHLIGGT